MAMAAEVPEGVRLFELLERSPKLAARHGVSALLVDVIDAPPAELVRDAQAQIAAGLKIRSLTWRVVDALGESGVRPILLKGYVLAARLYDQPLVRPSTDVDILVRSEELAATVEVLTALRLSRIEDPGLADPFEEHHHLSFGGSRGLVEVHFRLFQGFGGGVFDDESLQARAVEVKVDGRSIRVLGPEDEFLYLATHAANHSYLRLSWLVDLQRYVDRGPPLDWSVMAARARSSGFHTAVTSALGVLERVLGTRLPVAAHRHFGQPPLRRWTERFLFSNQALLSARLSDFKPTAFLLRLWLVDSWAFGARHVLDGARRGVRRALRESD